MGTKGIRAGNAWANLGGHRDERGGRGDSQQGHRDRGALGQNWGDPGTILEAVGMELRMQRGSAGGSQSCHGGWRVESLGGSGATWGRRWAVGTTHSAKGGGEKCGPNHVEGMEGDSGGLRGGDGGGSRLSASSVPGPGGGTHRAGGIQQRGRSAAVKKRKSRRASLRPRGLCGQRGGRIAGGSAPSPAQRERGRGGGERRKEGRRAGAEGGGALGPPRLAMA